MSSTTTATTTTTALEPRLIATSQKHLTAPIENAAEISSTGAAIDLSQCPKLDRAQLGHIRHFHNLASQPDNSWNHMGGSDGQQEWTDAYRYQLATMAYALSVSHFHRQPILRSVYKPLIRQLIHKMLLRSVWSYWFNTSHGGKLVDPDLKELRKPWADPVVRENIMYSGHVLLMTTLYGMLFGDEEFEKEKSIVFDWNPVFWGMGPERFEYDNSTLQAAILREMERTGYLGACCEPNTVFVVCNQFPIIAMRLRDVKNGTNVVEGFLERYQAAWEKKGMVGPNGQIVDWWMEKQDVIVPAEDVGMTAWTGAFMNSWNGEFVRRAFESQALGFLTQVGEEGVRFQPVGVANTFRAMVIEEGADPEATATLEQAKARATEAAKTAPAPFFPYVKPTLGYVVQWLSELGKTDLLQGLLTYIDEHMSPTWEDGGLYYPRNDATHDTDWNFTAMEPFTGNAAIGYARLNVEDGVKKMYEKPWTKDDLAARPYVDGVQLANGVDFVRGVWDSSKQVLVLTMRSFDGQVRMVKPVFKNLGAGAWEARVDGELRQTTADVDDVVGVDVVVGAADVDVVLVKRDG